MDLDIVRLFELNLKICEELRKKQAREQWLAMLPLMTIKMIKFKSFEDYYEQVSGKNIDLRPDSEILAEVEEIRREMREG